MRLEIGYNTAFEVLEEFYHVDQHLNFSVVFISDLHLNGFNAKILSALIAKIEDINPDIILLGGDYVDSRKGLIYFENLLQFLSGRQNVFAIAGNHDYFFGIQIIEDLVKKHNIGWIENLSVLLQLSGNFKVQIDGSKPGQKNLKSDFKILLLHKPVEFSRIRKNYNLAFAGHLHGSQIVFWKRKEALYPGKFFYRWNIIKKVAGNCSYFISKGLGDTLPIRFNCRKDIISVRISKRPF